MHYPTDIATKINLSANQEYKSEQEKTQLKYAEKD
jgi:hypothetical protein